jgi:Peptidase family M1 domain
LVLFFIFGEIILLKKLFLICILYCRLTDANCQVNYFQQEVNYTIDVTLNDANNTLDGFEVINYTNHSPDTLNYIWFHLWPNAYKNDRTAFSEQLLQLGRTDFYFSDEEKRGYINRLDFKVDGATASLEDHPLYIDVAKLILPKQLLPGETVRITTPFHEKIPFNFSRGGYVDETYQITQWYPKPAVYDNDGWHPMPYLDQGEFYSEFGNFKVRITLPEKYKVAATGSLISEEQSDKKLPFESVSSQQTKKTPPPKRVYKGVLNKKTQQVRAKVSEKEAIGSAASGTTMKTLTYEQNKVHDFAWFANEHFIVKTDTMQLHSGKIINVNAYYTPEGKDVWKNSIQFLKDAINTRSTWLGEYPYNTVTAVEAKMGFSGGMEYPTITSISPAPDAKSLDMTIEHEVGHNWDYGILASNERQHPWLDEGVNTYFDNRYELWKYGEKNERKKKKDFVAKKFPDDYADIIYRTQVANKKDQPIETSSADFSPVNYSVIAYYKTGLWMKELENFVGKDLFDSCLHEYYNRWQFKHPQPKDFEQVIEDVSKKNVKPIFSLLSKKGNLTTPESKQFKVASFFNFNNTNKYNYVFISPSVGYNYYDNIMVGALVHNYTLPEPRFHFLAAPMYATGSKTFTGTARAGFNIMSYGLIRKAEISISGAHFSNDEFTDSTGKKNYLSFSKIVPSVKVFFKNKSATSSLKKSIQWKTYFIQESSLLFPGNDPQVTTIAYPKNNRYLNQLTFAIENNRALYPYSANLVAEQANGFLRFAFEENYFFNYKKGGGMSARLFAGKFIYAGDGAIHNYETSRYYLNMTGANGAEDYTYSNYFIGRNEFEKLPSQQIMIRDGGFKVRTDMLNQKVGKTDDWLAALNLTTDFPKDLNPLQVLPVKIPLKLFLDVGTYAEAWKKNPETGKFIYDAGLQLALFKNMVNIYVPVLYSKVYSNYYKQTIPKNKRFLNSISFSIDIQNFRLNRFFDLPEL